ncbi:thiol-disulfide oxidoreductase DCC family protein [Pedobacter kyonggii]|uniref:DUF393 domain-containing protein n=1 Tax=Pedobacter kyonggii TaxID=1926871 RepID=A0A4Q9H8V1_9SPHI|nr:DCC1-like thiol-disulfide oxidoreductase family protein [Pedobacter kyonggii]TBO40325.1 DUF393 domain-containing protein [Pedobacter kyonggii]
MAPILDTTKDIILFDGVCNFCNGFINYIITHDQANRFCFAPLDSKTALQLGKVHRVNFIKLNSIIVARNNKFLTQSNAVAYILKNLNVWWAPLINVGYLVPGFIRNWLYKAFANNRYALFGQTDSCMLPTEHIRSKFLV